MRDRFNLRQTVSVYSIFSIQHEANLLKIASYRDTNGHSIISFKPDYLGLYLENLSHIHLLSDQELKELVEVSDSLNVDNFQGQFIVDQQEFTITHTRYKRDPRFKDIVYEAYGHRCAMCGIQLELIEAAHIVPHSHELGTDDISNGLTLCSLHHKAYDRSLIYFDTNFKIIINEKKMDYLEKVGKDSGFRKFQSLGFESIQLPDNYTLRPNPSNVNLANKIRGIV